MNDIEIIRCKQLEDALEKKYRLYLAGKLKLPQDELDCIDDDIEIGISFYSDFTADKPHMHPFATEHAYVLSGCVRAKMLDGSSEELEFHEGDFFIIRPGNAYATKHKAGTKIMFIKSPGGNDKTAVDIDEQTRAWLSSWDV